MCKAQEGFIRWLNSNELEVIMRASLLPAPLDESEVKFSLAYGIFDGVPPHPWKGIKRVWIGVQSMCFGHHNCHLKF